MIDTLLRALDLRTGRFTSPHLERMNERICIDGEPLTDEEFVRAFNDVAPYTHLVDASQPHPLSFFETIVGMAYAAFADAPVDVAVVEVGHGRRLGRHQRRRRRGRRGHADRRRPRPATSATPAERDRDREGRDHQARRHGRARRAAARSGRGAAAPLRGGRRDAGARGPGVRRGLARPGRRRSAAVAARGCGRSTTTSSSRCTARTRRRTPPLRWPRSRRSPATSPSTPTWCATRSPGRPRRGGWRSSAAAR